LFHTTNLEGNVAEEPRLVLAKPLDRSYEAFVSFINGFYEALTGKPVGEMDEAQAAEMRTGWREFWGTAVQAEAPAPPEKP
jgi:hypothetical protein